MIIYLYILYKYIYLYRYVQKPVDIRFIAVWNLHSTWCTGAAATFSHGAESDWHTASIPSDFKSFPSGTSPIFLHECAPIIASSNFHSIQEKWNSVECNSHLSLPINSDIPTRDGGIFLQQRPGLCAWHLQAKCGLHPEAGSMVDPAVLAIGKSPRGIS